MFITAQFNSSSIWRVVAIVGICSIAIGIGAGYVYLASHFRFEFLIDIFLVALSIGTLSGIIGFVGWARQLKRRDSR